VRHGGLQRRVVEVCDGADADSSLVRGCPWGLTAGAGRGLHGACLRCCGSLPAHVELRRPQVPRNLGGRRLDPRGGGQIHVAGGRIHGSGGRGRVEGGWVRLGDRCWRTRYPGLLPPLPRIPLPPCHLPSPYCWPIPLAVGRLRLVPAVGFLYGRLCAALILAGWWLLLPAILPRGDGRAPLQLPVLAWVTATTPWLLRAPSL
jgi:hypothetical protein